MKFSKDGSSNLKAVTAVNTTGVVALDGALATSDEADVQQVRKPVVDHLTAGAQTLLLKAGNTSCLVEKTPYEVVHG